MDSNPRPQPWQGCGSKLRISFRRKSRSRANRPATGHCGLETEIEVQRTNEEERKVEPPCALRAYGLLQNIEKYHFSVQSFSTLEIAESVPSGVGGTLSAVDTIPRKRKVRATGRSSALSSMRRKRRFERPRKEPACLWTTSWADRGAPPGVSSMIGTTRPSCIRCAAWRIRRFTRT
jgi:hypothetical protein